LKDFMRSLLTLIILLAVPIHVLEVYVDGKPLLTMPVLPRDTFTLSFTHSVERTPVIDCYTISDDYAFILTETFFKSLGAGSPSKPENGTFKVEDGWFKIEGINSRMDKILIRVSILTNQTFTFRGRVLRFALLAPDGGLVEINIGSYPLILYLLKIGLSTYSGSPPPDHQAYYV